MKLYIIRYQLSFPTVVPDLKAGHPRVTHPSATRREIQIRNCASTQTSMGLLVRLACLRHAASVHPEPGSNSQKYISICFVCVPSYSNNLDVLLSFQRSFQPLFCKGFLHSFVKCVLNIPHTDTYVNNFFEIFSFFLNFFQKNVFLTIL